MPTDEAYAYAHIRLVFMMMESNYSLPRAIASSETSGNVGNSRFVHVLFFSRGESNELAVNL